MKLLWFFKYFWVIVLLPKTMQLFVLTGMLLVGLQHKKIKISRTTQLFAGGLAVQLIAIILRIVTASPEVSRIYAAINTIMIWIIALLYFELFRISKFSEFELAQLHKYITYDLAVFFAIYLFSLVYKSNYVHIFGYQLWLRANSYMDFGREFRFVGFLGGKLSSANMFQFMLPIMLVTTKEYKISKRDLLVVSCGYFATMAGYSRIGMITCSIALFGYILISLNQSLFTKRQKQLFVGVMITGVLLFGLIKYQSIVQSIYALLYARSGSTNARIALYTATLNTVINESPIIGIGIKEIMNNGFLPLGSHSTYIGLFYKSGILGSIFFAGGLFSLIKKIWYSVKRRSYFWETILMLLPYFLFITFCDIDGSDWYIVGMMSTWGLICNYNVDVKHKPIPLQK